MIARTSHALARYAMTPTPLSAIEVLEQVAFDALLTQQNVASITAKLSGGGDSGDIDYVSYLDEDGNEVDTIRGLNTSWMNDRFVEQANSTGVDWCNNDGGDSEQTLIRNLTDDQGLPIWELSETSYIMQFTTAFESELMPELIENSAFSAPHDALQGVSGVSGTFELFGMLSEGDDEVGFYKTVFSEGIPVEHHQTLRELLGGITIGEAWQDEVNFDQGDASIGITGHLTVEDGVMSISELSCVVAEQHVVEGDYEPMGGTVFGPFPVLENASNGVHFGEVTDDEVANSFKFLDAASSDLKDELVEYARGLAGISPLFLKEEEVSEIVKRHLDKSLSCDMAP